MEPVERRNTADKIQLNEFAPKGLLQ